MKNRFGRRQLFVLERGMKHGTKFNLTRSRVPSRTTSLFATHPPAPSSSCTIPYLKPVLPRVLRVQSLRGTPGGPLRPHLGRGPQRHGSRLSRDLENGGCPDPFSIVSGHLQKAHAQTCSGFAKAWGCFGLKLFQLDSRDQGHCQRRGKCRTSRITDDGLISAGCFAPWSG